MSFNILSVGGWVFLPKLVTGWIQSLWYGITIRAGDPRPQPGTPRYIEHHRRIKIAVLSAYLLYTIFEADWVIQRASDYYQDLGVSHSATEKDIKSRFRRLAAIHHPDKVSSTSPSDDYFVHLKLAQDILLDPAKRFAYDRFGPSVSEWRHCSNIRDYLLVGLQSILPYYCGGATLLYVLGMLGYLEWGKYWRWLMLVTLCVFELHTISRPYSPLIVGKIINPILTNFSLRPPYLPFQIVQLVRKISITIYVAFSQIGPLLEPPEAARLQGNPELIQRQQLDRLEQTVKAVDTEATRLMAMEKTPFNGDPQAQKEVQGKISEWLVQNTIRNDPEVRDALGKLLQKRRVDAPAGARGNR